MIVAAGRKCDGGEDDAIEQRLKIGGRLQLTGDRREAEGGEDEGDPDSANTEGYPAETLMKVA